MSMYRLMATGSCEKRQARSRRGRSPGANGKHWPRLISTFSGGAAERVGFLPSIVWKGTIAISPDGHKILTASEGGSPNFELWALDNRRRDRRSATGFRRVVEVQRESGA